MVTEGGDSTDYKDCDKKTIQHQFDTICKRALRDERANYLKHIQLKTKHETLCLDSQLEQLKEFQTFDTYPSDMTHFSVHNCQIAVENDLLAEALSTLPQTHRDIVLLSYFLDLTDAEIAEILNIVRRTVQYKRKCSLHKIKRYLEGSE